MRRKATGLLIRWCLKLTSGSSFVFKHTLQSPQNRGILLAHNAHVVVNIVSGYFGGNDERLVSDVILALQALFFEVTRENLSYLDFRVEGLACVQYAVLHEFSNFVRIEHEFACTGLCSRFFVEQIDGRRFLQSPDCVPLVYDGEDSPMWVEPPPAAWLQERQMRLCAWLQVEARRGRPLDRCEVCAVDSSAVERCASCQFVVKHSSCPCSCEPHHGNLVREATVSILDAMAIVQSARTACGAVMESLDSMESTCHAAMDVVMTARDAFGNGSDSLHVLEEFAAQAADVGKDFCVDSGATSHYCANKNFFLSLCDMSPRSIVMADGTVARASQEGSISLICRVDSRMVKLHKVVYAPFLKRNFISVRKMDAAGMRILFSNSKCEILFGNSLIARGILRKPEEIYFLDAVPAIKTSESVLAVVPSLTDLWHKRVGHLSYNGLTRMATVVKGLKLDAKNITPCQSCAAASARKHPLARAIPEESRTNRVLARVCVDLKGPLVRTRRGFMYFLIAVDEYSRYVVVRLCEINQMPISS